jgi:tungstate transport system substrate-binding protein
VNAAGANAFADYLLSARAQSLIATFGVDRYGEQLFHADAGITEEELR